MTAQSSEGHIYHTQLKDAIGEGAYNPLGHRQEQFLASYRLGPYPEAFRQAWHQTMHEEAKVNDEGVSLLTRLRRPCRPSYMMPG